MTAYELETQVTHVPRIVVTDEGVDFLPDDAPYEGMLT